MLKNILIILFAAKLALVTSDGWDQYKLVHKKTYSSPEDEHKHRQIWEKVVKEIFEHNTRHDAGIETYRQAVNHLADRTDEELAQLLGTKKPDNFEELKRQSQQHELSNKELPAEVNWVHRGYVTSIKNQNPCGDCWAFGTIASLEAQVRFLFGHAFSLSEQQLTDCCGAEYNCHGCNGGWSILAFKYTHKFGVETFKDYPFEGKEGKCRYKKENIAFINNHTYYSYDGSEQLLKEWVAEKGVVSVSIEVTPDFYRYGSGVYTTKQCQRGYINHCVATVGYGTEDGKDYWLVKNSWGKWWGESGYIKMARNRDNMCNIASFPAVANYYLP